MAKPIRVVLYLNQFFGQIGGEEHAGVGPQLMADAVGPGRALAGLLAEGEELAGTLVCGDNYFAENEAEATAVLLQMLRGLEPGLLLAGPAFNAGRYGIACGALCKAAQAELGIPTVTGMFQENPGVDLYHKDVLILRTADNARLMRDSLAQMLSIGRRLVAGDGLGKPAVEGYFAQGRLVPQIEPKNSAERATDMLLAKLRGEPFASEVQLPVFRPIPAPRPIADLRHAKIALITDGGLVPLGNPDNIEGRASTRWGAYSVEGKDRLDAKDYEISHGGYDPRYILADPHRLVGLDVARELEREGAFTLHNAFLSTGGLSNPVDNSRRLGREMAAYIKEQGIDGVILTST
jgi:glycine reductase